jgi:alpha-methylacyl-CoA racemase
VLAALIEAGRSGRGQVVDAAMCDGTAVLMSMIHTLKAMGEWRPARGSNLLDGGAHFYGTYRCQDGKYLAVGAIEPQFYAQFLAGAGIDDPDFAEQWARARWPLLREKLSAIIAGRPRDAWCECFAGSDACVAPVLDMDEAAAHPHHRARGTFIEVEGVRQAAPAPRFGRSTLETPRPPQPAGEAPASVLADWGLPPERISAHAAAGAFGAPAA